MYLEQITNPLLPVEHWFNSVYPLLSTCSRVAAPLSSCEGKDGVCVASEEKEKEEEEYESVGECQRPLECLQNPGDVVYLPSGWSHLTVNVGETIAVGGQASYSAAER